MTETSVDGAGGHAKVVGSLASVAAVLESCLDQIEASWTASALLIRAMVGHELLPED